VTDTPNSSGLTHFTAAGEAHMVDVGEKPATHRVATASARIRMAAETAEVIRGGTAGKGDVLGIARIAGIMATKRTADLIPLCHPIPVTHAEVDLTVEDDTVTIHTRVETRGQTGVEMEALTAASVAALTVYDMTKAIDRGMVIEHIRLESKEGGRSGRWERSEQ